MKLKIISILPNFFILLSNFAKRQKQNSLTCEPIISKTHINYSDESNMMVENAERY